ncbi:S41 family peptidase [Enemella sp. A6]|uniref:S41 family peptidase n=1 Tax=Enemella sp. A6 TaxID=3440152 RepID=UPI003EB8BB00
MDSSLQRQVLEDFADLIVKHYVFSDLARVCADELRATATNEDGVRASRFAKHLTHRLRLHDRHFSVMWGQPDRPGVTTTEQQAAEAMSFQRRGRGGVLAIHRFDDIADPACADLARQSLGYLGDCDYAVIDVRDNDGGWPSMVEYLLAPLLGADPVHVLTYRSAGRSRVAMTRPDPSIRSLATLPVVVVVNNRTASAAESLAYALQSLSRATIVGIPSVGAANPVDLFAHPSGFHIYISTGAPIDPRTGTNWDQVGVLPDVVIRDEASVLDIALEIASTEC